MLLRACLLGGYDGGPVQRAAMDGRLRPARRPFILQRANRRNTGRRRIGVGEVERGGNRSGATLATPDKQIRKSP